MLNSSITTPNTRDHGLLKSNGAVAAASALADLFVCGLMLSAPQRHAWCRTLDGARRGGMIGNGRCDLVHGLIGPRTGHCGTLLRFVKTVAKGVVVRGQLGNLFGGKGQFGRDTSLLVEGVQNRTGSKRHGLRRGGSEPGNELTYLLVAGESGGLLRDMGDHSKPSITRELRHCLTGSWCLTARQTVHKGRGGCRETIERDAARVITQTGERRLG
ncbi:hypothetical protein BCR44DRAFT_1433775 [Catenaria anguillulae PL171]|uniref:Uncharacterized protein n=1 Tax=Catenaria anguillulae PL171 TaxID=765915 RepID=A0A1Y2HR06_9FUNG|nr:hypothetical protein BCR44DRAFT_1433775 [Catenaria anguillulae PL171]